MNMSDTRKQTVVLVHGAFADSSSWNDVIGPLTRAGHTVIAAANPLRGLPGDAAYVRSVLESIDGPIVVAGHSYGGTVMTVAADGNPNVTALVYVASFLPEVGESTGELANKFPGNQLGTALKAVPYPLPDGGTATDLYVEQDKFNEIFIGDVTPDVAARLAVIQRPIAEHALGDAATASAWRSIESWSLLAAQDLAVPAEAVRFMSERAGAHLVEIDASHGVTVSQPGAVADLILEAAGATAR
jgi:pimeloyl-ACP methyl ester carboxylesterase